MAYARCHSFSDFWDAYQRIFATDRPQSVGKDTDRPPILSVGSTPCASAWHALSAKPCPFPNPTGFMKLLFVYSFITTIWPASVNGSPLPQFL
jgi:hypothetical protein